MCTSIAQRQRDRLIWLAWKNPNSNLQNVTIYSQFDHLAAFVLGDVHRVRLAYLSNNAQFLGRCGRNHRRIVPNKRCHRLWKFLQPRIVGIASIMDCWIQPELEVIACDIGRLRCRRSCYRRECDRHRCLSDNSASERLSPCCIGDGTIGTSDKFFTVYWLPKELREVFNLRLR